MRDISKLSVERQRKITLKLGEEFFKGLKDGMNKTLEQAEDSKKLVKEKITGDRK